VLAGPLAGVRLLDLSWIVAGPLASRLLADFGAEVIKIESALRPDVSRANRIPLYGVLPGDANTNADAGGYFQDVNAGKLSCTVNLGHPGGRAILRRLVAISDGIVCNLGGDQLERWGLDYPRARAINPGIIVVNMPTMEGSGPRARWRAFGDMIAAAAGMKAVSGHPTDPPLPFGHQYPDFSANPFHAAVGLMAALYQRERTGEGQLVEVSQYESTVAMLGAVLLERSLQAPDVSGSEPPRPGNLDAGAVPHNVYRCRGEDAWCAIAVYNDDQWRALLAVEELASLRRDELATLDGRRQHQQEIDAAIEAWTVGWDKHGLAEFLQERGVAAGPFQGIDELVERDPTLGGRQFAATPHPSGREFLVHRNPLRFRHAPVAVQRGPLFGEHTYAVLHDLLGMSDDELTEAIAGGAVE
jgi:benzylsuccinate CoA-transferase BbsF subunit